MKLMEKILHTRLKKIRKELNAYIAEKRQEEYYMSMAKTFFPQEKAGTVMNSFCDCMRLNDDEVEDYFEDVEEECQSSTYSPLPQSSEEKFQRSERYIPEFLRKYGPKNSIDEALEQKEETFSTMLLRLIDEKELKDSEVYKKANIDRRLFSKIRGDEDYIPSKKTAIAFCLALQLEMKEAKQLLEKAGYALSKASRFDLIIMYLIEHKEYNIHFANIVLEDYGEGTLSK